MSLKLNKAQIAVIALLITYCLAMGLHNGYNPVYNVHGQESTIQNVQIVNFFNETIFTARDGITLHNPNDSTVSIADYEIWIMVNGAYCEDFPTVDPNSCPDGFWVIDSHDFPVNEIAAHESITFYVDDFMSEGYTMPHTIVIGDNTTPLTEWTQYNFNDIPHDDMQHNVYIPFIVNGE